MVSAFLWRRFPNRKITVIRLVKHAFRPIALPLIKTTQLFRTNQEFMLNRNMTHFSPIPPNIPLDFRNPLFRGISLCATCDLSPKRPAVLAPSARAHGRGIASFTTNHQ